jgi:uncharacterized protein (TIGR03086 family)
MSDAEALADLDRALAAVEAIVAGIGPDQWNAATPCERLDVRAVLNHLVTGNLLFAALISGAPMPGRDDDHLGSDPLVAFQRAATELRDAFARPGVMEAVYDAPFGTSTGTGLLQVRMVEILAHGWDLARATQQPAGFPAGVAERVLAAARQQLASRPRGPGTPFAAEVPVPDDAATADRLAGFLGRTV